MSSKCTFRINNFSFSFQSGKDGDLWLHIDAAYAGAAFICPEYRSLLNGVEVRLTRYATCCLHADKFSAASGIIFKTINQTILYESSSLMPPIVPKEYDEFGIIENGELFLLLWTKEMLYVLSQEWVYIQVLWLP